MACTVGLAGAAYAESRGKSNAMAHPAPLLLATVGGVVAGIWAWQHYRAMQSLLQDWARANNLLILSKKRTGLPPLSLWFTSSRAQDIYHVEVLDQSTHRIRHAWIRLGTFWGSVDGDAIDVRWDDET